MALCFIKILTILVVIIVIASVRFNSMRPILMFGESDITTTFLRQRWLILEQITVVLFVMGHTEVLYFDFTLIVRS